MARNLSHLVQFLSPGDEQLKAFIDEIIGLDIVASATIHLGPGNHFTVTGPNAWGTDFDNAPSDRYINEILVVGNDSAHSDYNDQNFPSNLTISRTVTDGEKQSPSLTLAEAYFGSSSSHHNSSNEFCAEIYPILLKHFSRNIPAIDPATDVKAFGIALTQMSEVSSNLISSLADARREQEARLAEALAKIDVHREEVESELEARRKDLAEIAEVNRAALDERESNLENARARDARRKLRNNITDDVKEKLDGRLGDKETSQLNWLVVFLAMVVVTLCLGLSLYSFQQFAEFRTDANDVAVKTDIWFNVAILIRGTLSFVTGIAFAYWLLNHLRSRAEQTLARRDRLERFSLDIDRASWVIETVMEFKEDEEGVTNVPSPWLTGATTGLFSEANAGSDIPENDSLSALSELLASGASLSLGNGGAELKLDPKASKKVAKSQK